MTRRCLQVTAWFLLTMVTFSFGQPLGVSQLPYDLTRTTLLIERLQINQVDDYQVIGTLPSKNLKGAVQGTRLDSNIYIRTRSPREFYLPVGSGVLISHASTAFLVTAAHVAEADSDLYFRIPQKSSSAVHRSYRALAKHFGLGWVIRKTFDLAIMPFGFMPTDSASTIDIDSSRADYDSVSLGDGVFVLGYPSSVVFTPDPTVHFVRDGIVSSKLPERQLIIDALLFPGNSGGPVFWKPARSLTFGAGLIGRPIPGRTPDLVGIVSRTLQYKEEALSSATGRTRVTFEENSGLAIVISSSRIVEILKDPEIQNYVQSRTN